MNIIDLEQPEGVIVQFGGQTTINLAEPLSKAGVKILGTQVEDLDRAEDRDLFEKALQDLEIPQHQEQQQQMKKKPLLTPIKLVIQSLFAHLLFWAVEQWKSLIMKKTCVIT